MPSNSSDFGEQSDDFPGTETLDQTQLVQLAVLEEAHARLGRAISALRRNDATAYALAVKAFIDLRRDAREWTQ